MSNSVVTCSAAGQAPRRPTGVRRRSSANAVHRFATTAALSASPEPERRLCQRGLKSGLVPSALHQLHSGCVHYSLHRLLKLASLGPFLRLVTASLIAARLRNNDPALLVSCSPSRSDGGAPSSRFPHAPHRTSLTRAHCRGVRVRPLYERGANGASACIARFPRPLPGPPPPPLLCCVHVVCGKNKKKTNKTPSS